MHSFKALPVLWQALLYPGTLLVGSTGSARDIDLLVFPTAGAHVEPGVTVEAGRPATAPPPEPAEAGTIDPGSPHMGSHDLSGMSPHGQAWFSWPASPVTGRSHGHFRPHAQWPCEVVSYTPSGWLGPAAELRRAAHFPAMVAIACEQGLPSSLLDAVIVQESAYNPRAVSHAGARGLMQIMPGTAIELGLPDPFDAKANMRAGARYLRRQLVRFGRMDLALAAYNAGPERQSLKHGRIPAIRETRDYVHSVTQKWQSLVARANWSQVSAEPGRGRQDQAGSAAMRDIMMVSFVP